MITGAPAGGKPLWASRRRGRLAGSPVVQQQHGQLGCPGRRLGDTAKAAVPHAAVAVTAEDEQVETVLSRVTAYGAGRVPILDDLQAHPGARRRLARCL